MYDILRTYVNYYLDIQKVRISLNNRLDRVREAKHTSEPYLSDQLGFLIEYAGQLEEIEEKVGKNIASQLNGLPIWETFLKEVKGIGPIYAGQLICLIAGKKHTLECKEKQKQYFSKKERGEVKRANRFECDCPAMEIERFPMVSSLWKYAGMHVVDGKAPGRKRGQQANWNPKLKSLCWKIAKSFVMVGGDYRFRYNEFKQKETETSAGKLSKRHIDMRARRKTVKLFLAHVFDKWYRLKGLTPPEPYSIGVMKHEGYIPPPSQ